MSCQCPWMWLFSLDVVALSLSHLGVGLSCRLTGAGLFCPQALRDASVLIFANKQDMKDSMTTVEISQLLTLSAIKDHPWHIQGCCALTGEGLVAAPPAPPGFGPTNEQLTIRTFSCFSPVRIWLTLSSWAESVKHPPTAEMLWVSSEPDRVPALRLILKDRRQATSAQTF